jgi:hypothetical protein
MGAKRKSNSRHKSAPEVAEPADDAQELGEVLARAEKGDAEALPRLRALLAAHADIWRRYSDLGLNLRAELIRLAAGENLLLREALQRRLEDMQQELAGPRATPLMRLLAERAALCWLEVHYHDTRAAQSPRLSGRAADELARRRKAAHHRLLTAAKALGMVRKILGQER